MKLTEGELLELLSDHQHDVPTYDAWYLEGCDGCNWKPSGDPDKRWTEYYLHLAQLILEVEQEAAEELAWLDDILVINPLEECTEVRFTNGSMLCSHGEAIAAEVDWDSVPTLRVD